MKDPNIILLARLDALEKRLLIVIENVDKVEPELNKDVWGTFYEYISTPAQRCITVLKEIETDLGKENPKLRDDWDKYSEVYEKSELLFAECIEFLGGLALREKKLDDGLCDLADDLLEMSESHTASKDWSSLTIPARQEPLSRLIRLRFPERTIWTLPLAAHQFSHVVLEKKSGMCHWIEEETKDMMLKCQLKDLAAVGLATCIMGPAYACSAITLGFNPSKAHIDDNLHMSDAKRAYVVFSILRQMKMPEEGLIGKLELQWRIALQSLGLKELEEDEKTKLNRWIESMWKNFKETLQRPRAIYPTGSDGLSLADDWSKKLDKGSAGSINPKGTESLRDALNAAWLCRITSEPNRFPHITEEALKLCKKILERGAMLKKLLMQGRDSSRAANCCLQIIEADHGV